MTLKDEFGELLKDAIVFYFKKYVFMD